MAEITVEITHQNINDGAPLNPRWCPVALAINLRLRPDWHAEACADQIDYWQGDQWRDSAEITAEVRERIERYDDAGAMTPFSLVVTVPDAAIDLSHVRGETLEAA